MPRSASSSLLARVWPGGDCAFHDLDVGPAPTHEGPPGLVAAQRDLAEADDLRVLVGRQFVEASAECPERDQVLPDAKPHLLILVGTPSVQDEWGLAGIDLPLHIRGRDPLHATR